MERSAGFYTIFFVLIACAPRSFPHRMGTINIFIHSKILSGRSSVLRQQNKYCSDRADCACNIMQYILLLFQCLRFVQSEWVESGSLQINNNQYILCETISKSWFFLKEIYQVYLGTHHSPKKGNLRGPMARGTSNSTRWRNCLLYIFAQLKANPITKKWNRWKMCLTWGHFCFLFSFFIFRRFDSSNTNWIDTLIRECTR